MEKKKRAAIAAVLHYLACEKLQMQAAGVGEEIDMEEAVHPAAAAQTVQHPWALSGRQAQMQMRHMMQMKAFH